MSAYDDLIESVIFNDEKKTKRAVREGAQVCENNYYALKCALKNEHVEMSVFLVLLCPYRTGEKGHSEFIEEIGRFSVEEGVPLEVLQSMANLARTVGV